MLALRIVVTWYAGTANIKNPVMAISSIFVIAFLPRSPYTKQQLKAAIQRLEIKPYRLFSFSQAFYNSRATINGNFKHINK